MSSIIIHESNSLSWKDVPQSEKEEAYELIRAHNNNPEIDKQMNGYYVIDVTGKHQVYYTLWRWRKNIDPKIAQYVKNPIYFFNLTTDLISSVKKALSKVPRTTELRIDADETKHHVIGKPEVFSFGKYRGQSFTDVYFSDPAYFAFLSKNMDARYENTKSNQIIKYFAQLYFEEMTKQNQVSSKSNYVGKIGDKYEGELKIYKIDIKQGIDFSTNQPKEYKVFKLIDGNENKFLAIDIDKHFPDVHVDDTVKLKGRIKDQKEIVGIKFNILNYVKAL